MKQAPLLLMFALHAFTNLLPVHIFNYQRSFGLVGWLDGRFLFFVFFFTIPSFGLLLYLGWGSFALIGDIVASSEYKAHTSLR